MGVPHFNALAGGDPCHYRRKWYIAKTRFFFAYISAAESIGVSSTTFAQFVLKTTEFGEIKLRLGRLRR